eukprot:TRINITY_DN27232_c0_g1_i1.p1 TRINITY_DN27232_c0_g1~~TRINITY_DN27232_c0_g1_i1.p1  ORF type:complete len:396 (+),score=151.05 TRINITY_DN27232_c0_g1_i1:75-1262(+)
MGILEQIKDIEHEMNRTQKNKATESHLGRLKGKLARLRSQLLADSAGGGGAKGPSFEVKKSGDVRAALIGFPSAGKSTLLGKVTKTESETAAYEFTTLTCIPGVINYRGTEIQLLDLPGIVEGAAEGRGRGKQVIATARTSDLILLWMDINKADHHRPILEAELEAVGIRLNKRPPNVYFKKKPHGSTNAIAFTATCKLTHLSEKLCRDILHDYKIHNAEVIVREDCTVDEFIDVVEGNRAYLPCIYGYSKVDLTTIEEVDRVARLPHSVVVSCHWDLNLDGLLDKIWSYLDLVRVYTKKKGMPPDFGQPFVLKRGDTIETVCRRIHKDILERFRYALVWGTSTKHPSQCCGMDHPLEDEDVIQIVVKTGNQLESDRFKLASEVEKREQKKKKKK